MEHIEIVTRWHGYRDFFRGDPEVIKWQRKAYAGVCLFLAVKYGYSTKGWEYSSDSYITLAYKQWVIPVAYLLKDTKALRYILEQTRV